MALFLWSNRQQLPLKSQRAEGKDMSLAAQL
jgi:hypothetical protein